MTDPLLTSKNEKSIVAFILIDRWPQKLLLILFSLVGTIAGLIVPLYQQQFILHFEVKDLLLTSVFIFFAFLFNQLTTFSGQKESIKSQQTLGEHMYKKSLINKEETLQHRTTGEMVSLYSTDVPSSTMWLEQSIPFFLTTFFPLILAPIFLVKLYAIPAGYTFSFVGLIFAFNIAMSYRQSIYFFRFKQLAAQRMGLVNEWVQNIKSIKVLNWIEYFERKILKKRIEETNNRIQMVTNGQIMNSVSSTVHFWINLFILTVALFSVERQFTGTEILTILWICGVFLSRPLRQLPWLLTMLFDAWTSIKRLQDFAQLQNQPAVIEKLTPVNQAVLSHAKNLNFSIGSKQILKSINLTIAPGQLYAIVGPLGSGKSSLLKSLMMETSFTATEFSTTPKTGYVPQDSFIMSASIAENVRIEYGALSTNSDPTDSNSVKNALQQASFDVTSEKMPQGQMTQIGERGLNLSGGQRQRLSLARAFTKSHDLYLLDDPFSAVDIKTEQNLIATVQSLKKSGSSFLIATHRYAILPQTDQIIYMDHGEIIWQGPYSAIVKDSELDLFLRGVEVGLT